MRRKRSNLGDIAGSAEELVKAYRNVHPEISECWKEHENMEDKDELDVRIAQARAQLRAELEEKQQLESRINCLSSRLIALEEAAELRPVTRHPFAIPNTEESTS